MQRGERGVAYRARRTSIPAAASLAFRSAAFATLLIAGPPCAPSSAQTPRSPAYVTHNWGVRDGLPVAWVGSVAQDDRGYIWLATFDGAVRFDGVRFTVFNMGNTPGLPTNRIAAVQPGRAGAVWLWTDQFLPVRLRNGRATPIRMAAPEPGEVGLAMFVERDAVWLGTSHGLRRVVGDSLVRHAADVIRGPVSVFLRRRDGALLVGTTAGTLFRAGDAAGAATALADRFPGITALGEDGAGRVWVGTDAGAFVGDGSGFAPVPAAPPSPGMPSSPASPSSPATPSLQAARSSSRNAVTPTAITAFGWSGLTGTMRVFAANGLFEGDASGVRQTWQGVVSRPWVGGGSVWYTLGGSVYRDGRLMQDAAGGGLDVVGMVDREGNVWNGGAGLTRLKPALFSVIGGPEGLPRSNVYVVYADSAGGVWVPTSDIGVTRVDVATGALVTHRLPIGPGSTANPFLTDRAGRLWLGGDRIFTCTPGARLACEERWPGTLGAALVVAMHLDARDVLWIGTTGGLLRAEGDRLERVPASAGPPSATVRAFAATPDGAIWMGTNGAGLWRYHAGRFTRMPGLPTDLVRALHVDRDGQLWVGTEGRGLARIDPRSIADTTAIVRIDSRHGLYDDVIHQILDDAFDRLWMSTNRGIFRVSRAELNAFAAGAVRQVHSVVYTEVDGLRNREANGGTQPAGARTADGRLWFPTQDGVAVVDPARVRRDTVPPPVIVERVASGETSLEMGDDGVRVGVDQRDLQLEFTALTFRESSNVRFRYRLDGYDPDWVDAGSRRTAFYTRVPPGSYAFHVQASDGAGGWYEPGAAVQLRVVPRPWETTAFRIALLVLAALLLAAGYRWRLATLRQRAAGLERLVAERTSALRERERQLAVQNEQLAAQAVELKSLDEAKTHFFANVSHELRTPLTLTIGPLEDLRGKVSADAEATGWLDVALRNSRRLLELVNQILDVARLEAGHMRLAPRVVDLDALVRGVLAAFERAADRGGIRLDLETAGGPAHCHGDPDALEKIVTNLVSNAVKFTPAGGSVVVGLERRDDVVQLRVTDTGRGFTAEQLGHVFERFYQVDEVAPRTQPGTGIGLSLVRELVTLHGGRIDVRSDGAGAGATFVVELPVGAAALDAGHPLAFGAAAGDAGLPVRADAAVAVATENGREPPGDDVPVLLVVEDSADLRRYIRAQFEPRFRVLEASDGAAGIAMARSHLPDVVISDVMMPGGTDGLALVRALRDDPETDFLPIVLLTARAADAHRVEGLERGADDYVVKPFDARELRARVQNLMASRRRLRRHLDMHRVELRATSPTASASDAALLERLRSALEQHISDADFGVAELARAVFLERSHLFRRTRELLGETPSDLLRRTRLEHAERLLRDDDGSVSDVAYAAGFNSVSYFCRCFQQRYGVTPAAYRSGQVQRS